MAFDEMTATAMREAGRLEHRIAELELVLAAIGDFAHDKSTGPAAPDALWEVRRMAYDAISPAGMPLPEAQQQQAHAIGVNEGLVLAIKGHIEGWASATFAWQDHADAAVAERNRAAAIEAHALECLRRIRDTLAHGVEGRKP